MAKPLPKPFNVFETTAFDEYEHRNYPKHLVPPGGDPMKNFVVVNSAEEEETVKAAWAPPITESSKKDEPPAKDAATKPAPTAGKA